MALLSPQLVEQRFAQLGIVCRFSDLELRQLDDTRIEGREGFFGFPTPRENEALSVLGLRELLGVDPASGPCFFDHPWYLEEAFGRERCSPGWHLIGMDVLVSSVDKPVYYAEEIKRDALYLPSAVEVLLMLLLHFAETGERLLLRKHTWTHDRAEGRRFVSVGAFGKKGVFVSSHEVGYKSRGLGICPSVEGITERRLGR